MSNRQIDWSPKRPGRVIDGPRLGQVLRRDASAVVLTVAVLLSLQCLRVLFPLAYSYREEAGLPSTIVLLVAVFAAPLAAPLLARIVGAGRTLLVCAMALGALRLAVQAVDEIPLALAAIASAVALLTVATILTVSPEEARSRLIFGILMGLALDTALRGAWATWDVAWHPGTAPALVTALLVALLIVAALLARRQATPASGAAMQPGLALGPYLMLQLLFLQSVPFAASSGATALATAVGVVLIGDLFGLAAVVVASAAPPRRGVAIMAGVALAIIGWTLPAAGGFDAVALIVAGQFLATGLLARTFAPPRSRRMDALRDTAGLGAGSLLLGLLLLLYQVHYDVPLPVSNRWLPALAGALLGLAAARTNLLGRTTSRGPRVAVPAIAVAALAVALFAGLTLTAPGLAATRTGPEALRVVTYNVHEAVTRTGQLDPEAMARTIERLHPDVLILEEVGRGWALSGTMDLAEWAKRRLGLPYTWAPAADHQFGNALFSRVPVRDDRIVSLPQGDGTMHRSAVIARVGPVDGEVITVIGVHLQNGSSAARKQTRIDELRILLHAWDRQPRTVLAGDLNSDPGSRELRTLLDAGFTTTQPTRRCTLKTSNQHCVDWILVTPDLTSNQVRALPLEVFDHRPLVATIRRRSPES